VCCSGGNAIVYEATEKATGVKWALKVIDRAVVTLEDSNQVRAVLVGELQSLSFNRIESDRMRTRLPQAELLNKVNHKNIIHLKDVLQSRSHLYLVRRPVLFHTGRIRTRWRDLCVFAQVLELATGGELFDRIIALKKFSERTPSADGRIASRPWVCCSVPTSSIAAPRSA
jgi:serine/threonine protein kinase